MALTLGIDVACRAAHQATLAVDGKTVWRGRKFWTRPADLERLWDDLDVEDPADLTVVVEPTRNAWIVLAEWFRRRGATVVMVPTTQSSDLRRYYSKHTKNDRIDSELLARLPLLHPEGLRPYSGQGPADPLRRLTKQRSTMVKRRTAVYARLDALTELLGPAWYAALNERYGIAALEFLARYGDPHAVIRLGQARLARFLIARSRGAWREDRAAAGVEIGVILQHANRGLDRVDPGQVTGSLWDGLGNRIATGFVGTPLVSDALSAGGRDQRLGNARRDHREALPDKHQQHADQK